LTKIGVVIFLSGGWLVKTESLPAAVGELRQRWLEQAGPADKKRRIR